MPREKPVPPSSQIQPEHPHVQLGGSGEPLP